MQFVLRDYPSSAALPAAVFQLDAGRGYRWHYKQRWKEIPCATTSLAELPPPVLKASDLILLVEVYFGATQLVSHALKGDDMVQLLRAGSFCIPVPKTTWTRDVELHPDLRHGCWSGWGLDFRDVNDEPGETIEPWEWSASVHLLRTTDYKMVCLFDSTTYIDDSHDFSELWSGRGEALGRAWTSTPDTFDAERPFERSADLVEGGMFEMVQERLPMDEGMLSGLACAHMRGQDVTGLGFIVSPTFKLPPSPRSFVYERLMEGVSVRCKNTSNYEMNKLRRIMSRCWLDLEDDAFWQAFVDAGMSQSKSLSELLDEEDKRSIAGQVALSEVRVSFGEVDHEDAVDAWCGGCGADDGDYLLQHMLDALVWT